MRRTVIGALLFVTAVGIGCSGSSKSVPRAAANDLVTQPSASISRQEFAGKFAKIQRDMPATRAREILGAPDAVHTASDPGGISLYHIAEIWRYGVDDHTGFATLGNLAINDQGNVEYFSGTQGGGDIVARLGETEVRRLLSILDGVKGIHGNQFDPRSAIAAVNALQPLGSETGTALMREYLRVSLKPSVDDDTGMIALMRLLFEPPSPQPHFATQPVPRETEDFQHVVRPGYFRQSALGAPDWTPDDPVRFPRFPLTIVDDVPLSIVAGYSLAGHAEDAESHLEALVDGGAAWRKTALRPNSDITSVLTRAMSQLPRAQQAKYEPMIANQLLRLVDTVYQHPVYSDDEEVMSQPEVVRAVFTQATKKIQAMHIRWDDQLSCFTRADGTILPPIVAPAYRSNFFNPNFTNDPGFKLNITVTRENKKRVSLSCETNLDKKPHPLLTAIRVIRVGEVEKVLTASDNMKSSSEIDNPDEITKWSNENFDLEIGEKIQIQITHGEQCLVSPVYEP